MILNSPVVRCRASKKFIKRRSNKIVRGFLWTLVAGRVTVAHLYGVCSSCIRRGQVRIESYSCMGMRNFLANSLVKIFFLGPTLCHFRFTVGQEQDVQKCGHNLKSHIEGRQPFVHSDKIGKQLQLRRSH